MPSWDESMLLGPEGEDWRVPVSELAARQRALADVLCANQMPGALIQHPVDLYYFSGGRQNSSLFIPATGAGGSVEAGGDGPVAFVRRSLDRAIFEAGGDDAPHEILPFPRMSQFAQALRERGVEFAPGLQFGEIPHSFAQRFSSALSSLSQCQDITALVHGLREVKSAWERQQLEAAAEVQMLMFEAVDTIGDEGVTELELVAAAEAVSRASGFGGSVQMRRYPLQCDRGVVVAGRAGGIPSFFDSAVGGVGGHPLSGMGAGFSKVKNNEPILVDLVHAHRGYMVDMTRIFVSGRLSNEWETRLESMLVVKDCVVASLAAGKRCDEAWEEGYSLAVELGEQDHLMGMKPDQSSFLGHSIGLQLDESPVVAAGFARELPVGGTMAIEPKVVYPEGSIGSEDTWIRDENGMSALTGDGAWPWITEW